MIDAKKTLIEEIASDDGNDEARNKNKNAINQSKSDMSHLESIDSDPSDFNTGKDT